METFEKLIEAQTKMMSAHAKTIAVQNFPPLHSQVRLTVRINHLLSGMNDLKSVQP